VYLKGVNGASYETWMDSGVMLARLKGVNGEWLLR
jgi:hypothetical protein